MLQSRASKDALIEACAQAIPIFSMSCFDLTKTLCQQMGSMICRYQWAQQEKKNKVHWLSWEMFTKPKSKGGSDSGTSMGSIQSCWRASMQDAHSPGLAMRPGFGGQVLSRFFYPGGASKSGISYTWRSILKGVELLREGVIWRTGDGTSMHIWNDPWLARDGTRRL